MGSSLFPNYTLEKNPYLELQYWKIFKGTNKSTGDIISAFIFEKKILDKKAEKEKDNILLCLRKEPETLIRGKNKHKNFLNMIEPLKEDNYSIGFITEYVNYNLNSWINNYHPSKLEIKYIIYQLLSVVVFIHNEYHISHNNLNPDNIFITEDNFIKITGFMFNTSLIKDSNNNNIIFSKKIMETYYNLKYIFPELILNNEITNNSDSFLIGLICYYLLGNNKNDLFVLNDNSYNSYKNTYKSTNIEKKINLLSNDELVKDFLKSLLQNNSEKRKNLSQIQNSQFFLDSEDNNKLIPLCLLSKMESAELTKNYDLLKLLPNILSLFSKKEKEFLILPNLLYYLKVENLINPIVPSLFLLCEQNNKDINFEEKIWPTFKKLFNMKKIPAATLYLTLKKLSFLINNINNSEFNKYCIPLICKALDCGVLKIQEVILEELPNILKNLDKNEFQNSIYNRLVKIIIQTKNKQLRKKIMNFFICLTDYFDSYFINNNFLDDIEKVIKSETTLNICQNALILYEKLKLKVNDKSVRSKIIPSLLLMMCNGEISEELFNKGENIIYSYIQKIKEKRKDQFIKKDIESDSDDKKINNNNNSSINGKNTNINKQNNYNIINNLNSPQSISRTKSTLSGNISLFEIDSSEGSNFGIDDKKKNEKVKKKEKMNKDIQLNKIYNNNNIFDNILNDINEDIYNKNQDSSFDSTSIGKNKNDFDFLNKKEFLSSLELQKLEANKKKENQKENKQKSNFKENKKSPWEEIESDDENTDDLKRYIKPKKIKEANKNNDKQEKEKEKSDKKKKWDEDEDEKENDDNLIYTKNEKENDLIKESINKNDNNNSQKNNNEKLLLNNEDEFETENKNDTNEKENKEKNKDKDESNNKKKVKKKKKKHKKKENKNEEIIEEKEIEIQDKNVTLGDKIRNDFNKEKRNNIQKEEIKIEKQISTTKMRMNQRAANIDLDNLLDDD